jgi:Lecithin:cholesterol acyltransferase
MDSADDLERGANRRDARRRYNGAVTTRQSSDASTWWPFLTGLGAGVGAAVLVHALTSSRRWLDPGLLRAPIDDPNIPITVLVPGILGSQLVSPEGTHVWFNFGNAIGSHDLSLPFTLPLGSVADDLVPAGLLGVDAVLPRLFGFTEYADLTSLLEGAGFGRVGNRDRPGAAYHIFTYDWRRDLVEAARHLHDALEALADVLGQPDARFNLVGHSMGGLVSRYYLRYGGAAPDADAPVTWAGAKRINTLTLVGVPNGGSIPALETILGGTRVGLSHATLSASTVASMPSIYELLPPRGAAALVDVHGQPLEHDLHDPATWEALGWGPFGPGRRRGSDDAEGLPDPETHRAFVIAALHRAHAFHDALARPASTPCPARVLVLGGDCLPTLARGLVGERRGAPPRFEAWTRTEAHHMFAAGDGRVTRASVLSSHLPGADERESGSGLPEVAEAIFGSADHHGIYSEPTFQSILLRRLLRPVQTESRDREIARRAVTAG